MRAQKLLGVFQSGDFAKGGGRGIPVIGFMRATVPIIINFAFLCGGFDAKVIIATGACTTPIIEISLPPLAKIPLWKSWNFGKTSEHFSSDISEHSSRNKFFVPISFCRSAALMSHRQDHICHSCSLDWTEMLWLCKKAHAHDANLG